jgi:hypothetical protein
MRGDSRQDLYAKFLAILGLGLLAGVGALVDYWPTDVRVPHPANVLVRMPLAPRAIAVPSTPPVIEQAVATVRRSKPSHGLAASLPVAVVADFVPAAVTRLSAPPPVPAHVLPPVAAVAPPAQEVALSLPAAGAGTQDAMDTPEEPLRQFSGGSSSDDSFFLTDGFKTAGDSLMKAGGSVVTAGVKTGQSLADAFRAAAGAMKKLKFF